MTVAKNYIRLEPGPFRARSLDFLLQNIRPFTTPTSPARNQIEERTDLRSRQEQRKEYRTKLVYDENGDTVTTRSAPATAWIYMQGRGSSNQDPC